MSTIGGNSLTEVTIDGDIVTTITVDGDVVWSVGETYIEAFTTVGDQTWNRPSDVTEVEVLVVGGGGGGGGKRHGGGGGAGGLVHSRETVSNTSYPVTVGGGGNGGGDWCNPIKSNKWW